MINMLTIALVCSIILQALQIDATTIKVCDGKIFRIDCGPRSTIQINSASYCNERCGTRCNPDSSFDVVYKICNFENSCYFECNNWMFQSSCIVGKKCLTVNYSCIPDKTSPAERCGKNEEFVECRTACPQMCSILDYSQPTFCTEQCIPPGCQCKPGYLRDCITGECLFHDFCPVTGEENEVFTECKAGKQKYCQNCEPGYICRPPYIRNRSSRKCILSCRDLDEECSD